MPAQGGPAGSFTQSLRQETLVAGQRCVWRWTNAAGRERRRGVGDQGTRRAVGVSHSLPRTLCVWSGKDEALQRPKM